jgi:hypothetical protein
MATGNVSVALVNSGDELNVNHKNLLFWPVKRLWTSGFMDQRLFGMFLRMVDAFLKNAEVFLVLIMKELPPLLKRVIENGNLALRERARIMQDRIQGLVKS